MTDEVESLIKDGIRAYKSQKRVEAFEVFSKATELDPYNAQAWLWLSAVVDTEEDQRVCLENVLHIDPNNAAAQKGLKMLDAKRKSAPPPAPEPPPVASAPPVSEPPATPSAPSIATSSASAFYDGPDISGDEYDDWAASLPIANAKGTASLSPFTDNSAFLEDDVDFDSAFSEPYREDDSLDDVVGDDPFGTGQGYEDDAADDDIFGDSPASFQSGPFSAGGVDDLLTPASTSTRADRSATSPRSPISTSARSSGGGAFLTDDLRASANTIDEADPGEYFRMIPSEIKATRLPGISHGAPVLAVLGVLVLLVANVAVLILLINRLAG